MGRPLLRLVLAAHAAWLVAKHGDLVAQWRDELGVLPRREDAVDARDLANDDEAAP